jgi:hypothetical protein
VECPNEATKLAWTDDRLEQSMRQGMERTVDGSGFGLELEKNEKLMVCLRSRILKRKVIRIFLSSAALHHYSILRLDIILSVSSLPPFPEFNYKLPTTRVLEGHTPLIIQAQKAHEATPCPRSYQLSSMINLQRTERGCATTYASSTH